VSSLQAKAAPCAPLNLRLARYAGYLSQKGLQERIRVLLLVLSRRKGCSCYRRDISRRGCAVGQSLQLRLSRQIHRARRRTREMVRRGLGPRGDV